MEKIYKENKDINTNNKNNNNYNKDNINNNNIFKIHYQDLKLYRKIIKIKNNQIKNTNFKTLIIIIASFSIFTYIKNENTEKNYNNDNYYHQSKPTDTPHPSNSDYSLHSKNNYVFCDGKKCKKYHGFCQILNKEEKCICGIKYSTIKNNEGYECNYHKKYQITAFLLELFLSNGIGHLYLGNYYIGIPKLFVWVFAYYFFISMRIILKQSDENKKASIYLGISALFCCLIMLTWQIFDLIYLGLNKYDDSNGIKPLKWFDYIE
jgi:hypothetical protein